MDDLVQKLDYSVPKMMLAKYENGQLQPNSAVVIALSKALNLPIDYFFRSFALQINDIKFRKTKSKLTTKTEQSIKAQIADLIERYIHIEEVCNVPVQFAFPINGDICNTEDVKLVAHKVREAWSIGNYGIVSVIDLLEEHGVKVLEIDTAEAFDGLSSVINDKYHVIVLNKNHLSEKQRFTVLHELGHLILRFTSNVSERDEENLCNQFAS